MAATLKTIGADPKHLGAAIGFLAILHTWGQNLLFHPHLHCVVPGGGLSFDEEQWISCHKKFFLPVRVLSRLFRRLFLQQLRNAYEQKKLHFSAGLLPLENSHAFSNFLHTIRRKEWIVYAKPPFAGSKQVLEYLGRYTHRVAISNNRLIKLENGHVTFFWKDYRQSLRPKPMTLSAEEFIRRFLLYVLPAGFVRIRSFGFLANRCKMEKLKLCRILLQVPAALVLLQCNWKTLFEKLLGYSPDRCPLCGQGTMTCIETFLPSNSSTLGFRGNQDSNDIYLKNSSRDHPQRLAR